MVKRKNVRKKECRWQKSTKLSKLLDLLKRCHRLNCCPLKKIDCIYKTEKIKQGPCDAFGSIDSVGCTPLERGDVLLKKPTQYNNLSIINRNKRLSEFLIPEGYYYIVLDTLVRIRKTTNNSEKDSCIYPLLYNFRHYLELTIKNAIRNFRIASGEIIQSQLGYKKDHSLLSLWNKLKIYIDDIKSNECVAFEELIKELHDIDPNSFSFRYSYKGNADPDSISEPIFNDKIDIDLENLEKVIERMHCFIEGISDLSYHQRDQYETNTCY